LDDLLVRRAGGGLRVDPKQNVQVVVQDGESTDSHREDLGQLIEAFFDPRPPIARPLVEEKRAADTAIDAVIPACDGNIDELGTSAGPARTLGGLGNMGCLRPDPFLCIPFSVLLHSRRRTENELWQTVGIFLWMKL
jgi:hypothetical protein